MTVGSREPRQPACPRDRLLACAVAIYGRDYVLRQLATPEARRRFEERAEEIFAPPPRPSWSPWFPVKRKQAHAKKCGR